MDEHDAAEQAFANGYSAGYEAGRRSVGRNTGRWEKPSKYGLSDKFDTNADRIRAMSDDELAEVLGKLVHCGGCPMRGNCKVDNLPCDKVLLEWLKQPVEGHQ